MGEFLTESSQLEDLMLNVYIYCHPDRPIGDSFNEFADQTFGGKIAKFKKACGDFPLSQEHQAILREVYPKIDALLAKRNYIVHGLTREGDNEEPYRMGKKRGDLDFISRVFEGDLSGENVFTVARIDEATDEFFSVRSQLEEVADVVMTSLKPHD
jgi:hypothetical protein